MTPLVPVDAFVGHLPVAEMDDRHEWHLHAPPLGAIPGSIQSVSMVWANLKTISSTNRSLPIVRETWIISTSGGIREMKCRARSSH